MALPVNIEDLVHGNTIEWERIEFKEGWNPEVVIRSICAFANDINNWGGGYIVIGIGEEDGKPILPPVGLQQNQLDPIQKKLLELSYKLSPQYFPIAQPYVLDEKHILVIWCPAGDNRPYKAPENLAKQATYYPYIRFTANSIKAQGTNLTRLQELTARIPFDDRINNRATLDDLDLGLIRQYLHEVKSDLFEESATMPFPDLCRTMLIAKGPDEDIRPVNIGLLFFSENPEHFFERTWIEVVHHQDKSGKKYSEKYFKGPIQNQLRDTLSYFKSNVISESVIKSSDKAESDRFYNFPFEAIEEALSNAVYHKSYELGSPIEVQIFPDEITILSHPAPVPPVNNEVLSNQKRIIAREYRNRRIGDFLKELKLTEGRGTGLPSIYSSLEANGSPEPSFKTDDASYVLVTIPAHAVDQASDGANDQVDASVFNTLDDVLAFCDGASDGASDGARQIVEEELHDKVEGLLKAATTWISREELFESIGLSNHSSNRKRYLDSIIDLGMISMEYPDTPTHPKQRYKTTKSGQRLLTLLKRE
tara:strand:+ start:1473 stop:3080 length:1608 start_codon:yes stop_codon:yes gene_type:complete